MCDLKVILEGDITLKNSLEVKVFMSVLYFSCQGLAALCEKEENPQYKAELPGVYEKLLLMYER